MLELMLVMIRTGSFSKTMKSRQKLYYDPTKKTPLKTTKLLSEVWKLPEPELIISLHGTVCMDLIAGNHLNFYR